MDWLIRNRLLIFIYLVGTALALSELRLPEEKANQLDQPETYIQPEKNVADVSAALYPGRALTLYYQAFKASLCTGPSSQQPEACRSREPVKPGEVRELFERAIATGNRSIEMLLYNYAVVLIQEGAPQEEIDAAVREWRLAHPGSQRPDPRTLFRSARP